MTDSTGGDAPDSPIDWRKIHTNLEQARTSLENGWKPSPEEEKRILRARARALGRSPDEAKADSATLRIVEFLLGKERYAIECKYVREIFPLKDITPLPRTPSFIAGIVNVRGRIVSVVNLKTLFDLPQLGLTDLNRVIILQEGRMEFGLLVDAVAGVRQIALGEIQPPLPTMTGLRARFSQGVTKDSLVILKADGILRDETLIDLVADNG
jgi:purine-binding chemotaxis protein CheW